MAEFSFFGRLLILLGVILVIIGLILTFANKIPFIGRLPGDIFIQKKNFSFYFPITTCILISIVISLILIFLSRK